MGACLFKSHRASSLFLVDEFDPVVEGLREGGRGTAAFIVTGGRVVWRERGGSICTGVILFPHWGSYRIGQEEMSVLKP